MSIMLKITVIVAVIYLFMTYIVLKSWVNGLSALDKLRLSWNKYTKGEQIFLSIIGSLKLATYICAGITVITAVFHFL